MTQQVETKVAEEKVAEGKAPKKAPKKVKAPKPGTKAPAKKAAAAKVAKKAPKKVAKKSTGKSTEKAPRDRSMAKVPPGERKTALVKVMRKLGATGATSSRTIPVLAEATGYTQFDVYGLLRGTSGKADSGPRCLVATGHVKAADTEEGLAFYLTAKGQKTGFNDIPFVSGRTKAEK